MNRYFANLGDVWKHLVLAELLALEPPSEYWETHAGSASYPLTHSPARDYGAYWYREHAREIPALAGSHYSAELDRLASESGGAGIYPGSALWAMRALGDKGKYFFCDLDPASTLSLRESANQLGLGEQTRVLEGDGMTAALAEATSYQGDPAGVFVTVDPFEPFAAAGSLSAIELASALIMRGFKVLYWYSYDVPEQRLFPMGMLREYARETGATVWCGDLMLASVLGRSEGEVEELLTGADGPGAGCGVICGNFQPTSTADCTRLGDGLASAWREAKLPNGSSGALDFRAVEE